MLLISTTGDTSDQQNQLNPDGDQIIRVRLRYFHTPYNHSQTVCPIGSAFNSKPDYTPPSVPQ